MSAWSLTRKPVFCGSRTLLGLRTPLALNIRADEYPSMAVAKAAALDAPSVRIWHLIWMRSVVKREGEKELDDHWEEISASAKTVPSKEGFRDRLRAYLDRLPRDKIEGLFQKVGTTALNAYSD